MLVLPQIRLAGADDVRQIARMSREQIEHGLAWSWTEPRVAAAVRDGATNVVVMHEQGRVSAFGIMMYGDERAHLSLLAVQGSLRRRGYATRLLQWLERCADTAGIGTIRVEARSDNPGAVAFYERQGYRVLQRIPGYYAGRLDALRLEKSLWPAAAPPPA